MKTIFKKLSVVIVVVMLIVSCSSDSGDTPCVPIACLNGGTSTADCGCACPQGFTGSNCSTQITPTQIKITKIRVKKFPSAKPNGNWWDILPNSDADIYVTIQNSNLNVIYNHPTVFTDAEIIGSNFYDFIPASPLIITNVNSQYLVNLYDYDGFLNDTNNDFIGFAGVTLYSLSQTGFPSTKTLTGLSGLLEFELTLSYVW
jgi:hypothetical protein